jgi:hypothetical protein
LQLTAEYYRVEDDAIANYVEDVRVENAARHLVQHVLLAIEGEGMAGVGATLKAGYGIVGRGEYVNDFSFSFVAPLEAY